MNPEPNTFIQEDLIGAWECFKGDGIHGWDHRVLVFRRSAGQLLVEYWLPEEKHPTGQLRLWGTYIGGVRPTPSGIWLHLEKQTKFQDADSTEMHLAPSEDGSLFVINPYALTAGFKYYRRTRWPRTKRT